MPGVFRGLARVGLLILPLLAAGCSRSDGLRLVEAAGVVTYQGAPLPGARVTFVPQNGPVATGVTDLEGKFELRTGTLRGVVAGPSKVSVTAPGAETSSQVRAGDPSNPESMKAMMSQMIEGQKGKTQKEPPGAIPKKYGSAQTSGLAVTVTADPGQNQFELKLN